MSFPRICSEYLNPWLGFKSSNEVLVGEDSVTRTRVQVSDLDLYPEVVLVNVKILRYGDMCLILDTNTWILLIIFKYNIL